MLSTDLLPPDIAEDAPLLDAAAELEQLAGVLDLEDWIVRRLKHADREITVNIPLQREESAINCAAYRVQHLRAHRHCLGPARLAPDAHLAELRAAALDLTLQYALFDLPLGGSAGAIVCDPDHLTESELRHAIRDYLAALDTQGDVFAIADYAGAWTSAARHLSNAALVGKHSVLGGLADPASAIANGWLTVISECVARVFDPSPRVANPGHKAPGHGSGVEMAGYRVSVQGVGASAMKLAGMLHQAGAKVIGLADKSGGIFGQTGLDVATVNTHLSEHHMLYACPGAGAVSNADVLESDCDLLVLAAAERQVNRHNTARMKAKVVLEAVPRAITPIAAAALSSRGVTVIPAMLGTAPRTLAWVAEWQSGLRYESLGQQTAGTMICRKLEVIASQVNAFAAEHDVPIADACRLLSLKKFAAVLRLLN